MIWLEDIYYAGITYDIYGDDCYCDREMKQQLYAQMLGLA